MMGTFADNREGLVYASYTVESIASNREDFVGTYGSLFFLAILLRSPRAMRIRPGLRSCSASA